ncbi:MAG: class I SAM-dependent methyltransferase [Candidatus Sungbacteria bacterium]|nr:class I SAM-dependent methyltransferase [Candidatus Sungbacteria bacterium]
MKNLKYKQVGVNSAIVKRWLTNKIFPWRKISRSGSSVREEYGVFWESAIRVEELSSGDKAIPFVLDGKIVRIRSVDGYNFCVHWLSQTIKQLQTVSKITSILELGCGVGLNLLALASLHPEIPSWHGLELTQSGVDRAKAFVSDPPLDYLRYTTGLPDDVIIKRLSQSQISFTGGDMRHTHFSDNAFDFSFTAQAIEQLPRDYSQAFREICRITRGHSAFIEEFDEAQTFFTRLHLKNVDYFRSSVNELERAGFKLLRYEPYPLSRVHLRLGFAVCVKEQR